MRNESPKGCVTGVSGFVGTHLSERLFKRGWRTAGYDIRPPHAACEFYKGDLFSADGLKDALKNFAPDATFHLAGILKSDAYEKFYAAHALGTISLFDALSDLQLSPTVLIASSSAVYGPGAGRKPISETFSLRPQTHYALSKVAQEAIAFRYHRIEGLPVICARTFNLLGPGLSPDMACSSFARQIAVAEKTGKPARILTGDLNAKRDFVDARDAARAYEALAQKGRPGEVYNVCSGRAVAIGECLDILTGESKVPLERVLDPSRKQANDVPIQIGFIDESLRRYEDAEWLLRYVSLYRLIGVNEPLARVHRSSSPSAAEVESSARAFISKISPRLRHYGAFRRFAIGWRWMDVVSYFALEHKAGKTFQYVLKAILENPFQPIEAWSWLINNWFNIKVGDFFRKRGVS